MQLFEAKDFLNKDDFNNICQKLYGCSSEILQKVKIVLANRKILYLYYNYYIEQKPKRRKSPTNKRTHLGPAKTNFIKPCKHKEMALRNPTAKPSPFLF